ncbi:hypothetical protein D9611_005354 [Ephemerocybe angulata]|uniref:IPT/TIG domain-containing protein n=1 Tax=Ephemerocybe angulata TaxID=980116 RepID=A0A8H5FD69_9AGAR|nr:hypothetical protein D9611_005354 [Tulosesus angulatus]
MPLLHNEEVHTASCPYSVPPRGNGTATITGIAFGTGEIALLEAVSYDESVVLNERPSSKILCTLPESAIQLIACRMVYASSGLAAA